MENRSSSHKPVTSLLILLIIGVIILGILVALQNREIHRLAEEGNVSEPVVVEPVPNTTVITPTPPPQGSEQGENLVVMVKNVGNYSVTHYCDGSVINKLLEDRAYCIGKNRLVFTHGDVTKEIATENFADAAYAALLADARLVPSKDSQRIIIKFLPDTCKTLNDADDECQFVAFSDEHNLVLNIDDLTVRKIAQYPGTTDKPFWNSMGTKAIFPQISCSGGGCTAQPLLGYDLNLDTKKVITKEEAAFNGDFTADLSQQNEAGYWSEIKWTSDSKFSATIINPSGVKKVVTGTF